MSQRTELVHHLDGCVPCQEAVTRLANESLDASVERSRAAWSPTPGERLDRFSIIGLLGTGAMGMVFEARDEDLGRTVALKVLRPEIARRPDGIQRLQREARAMAQLRHPNIVTVYDVRQAGDVAFIAMERIEGPSLRAVIERGDTSRDQLWAYFLDAGRSLAAAHAAQLVHCDFKPDNVLIDCGHIAKVGDFGLASSDTTASTVSGDPDARPRPAHRSQTGGTPRYMAPEVMQGQPASPASDQYSFCLALAEAMSCSPVLGSRTWDEVVGDKRHERLNLRDVRRPSGVRRALARGLSSDPGRRFRSMHDLLAALQRGQRGQRARSRQAIVVGVLGTATALAWSASTPTACRDAVSRTAPVWNPARRSALWVAADQHPGPAVHEAATIVATEIDARIAAWTAAYETACADRRDGDGNAGRTLACLDEDLVAVDTLASLLDAPLSTVAAGDLIPAAIALPQPSRCPERAAGMRPATDDDPQTALAFRHALTRCGTLLDASQLEPARDAFREAEPLALALDRPRYDAMLQMAQARVHVADGRFVEALDAAAAARRVAVGANVDSLVLDAMLLNLGLTIRYGRDLAAARELSADAQAWLERMGRPGREHAQLLLHRSTLALADGRPRDAESLARQAAAVLEEIGADPLQIADAWEARASALGDQGLGDEAHRVQESVVQALRARIGGHHERLADALANLGTLVYGAGHYEAAQRAFLEVLAIRRATLGAERTQVGQTLNLIGACHNALGRSDQAASTLQEALRILEQTLGPQHHELASALTNLGNARAQQGRYDDAVASFRRAARLREAALGPQSPRLAITLGNLADALTFAGRHDEALAAGQRALTICQTALGDHPKTAFAHAVISLTLRSLKRYDEAEDHLSQSIRIRRELLGEHHPDLVSNYINLGELQTERQDLEAARVSFLTAMQIARQAHGEQHLEFARAVHHRGLNALQHGDAEEAVHWLGQSLALRDGLNAPPVDRADARMRLAQALQKQDAPGQRDAVCTMAGQAQALYAALGSEFDPLRHRASALCGAPTR